MSGEGPNRETFQTSTKVRQRGNENPILFSLFLDDAMRIYKDIQNEMGTVHLSIPSHI